MQYQRNMSSRFPKNLKAFASEAYFTERLEEIVPWYYLHSDVSIL